MSNKKELKLPDFTKMNVQIFSSIESLHTFQEGSIYNDYVNEINVRIQQLQELLEDTGLEYSGRHYDLFRGGILCLRQMKDIFNDLMRNKEDQLLNTEEPQDEI